LPRFQSFETTSECCTTCYLRHLVIEYPSYQPDGTVNYHQRETPLTDYIYQIGRFIPKWVKDPAVIKKYGGLGSINEQIAPFWDFAKGVKPV
jgi:hypothetical protein